MRSKTKEKEEFDRQDELKLINEVYLKLIEAFPYLEKNKKYIFSKLEKIEFEKVEDNIPIYEVGDRKVKLNNLEFNFENTSQILLALQDRREEERLQYFGFGYYTEFKSYGTYINLALNTYIIGKMFGISYEYIDFSGIIFKVNFKEKLFINNLANQLLYLFGEENIVKSSILSNDKAIVEVINLYGEDTLNKIDNLFKQIDEKETKLKKNAKQYTEQTKEILNLVEDAQMLIEKNYLEAYYKLSTSYEELKKLEIKIKNMQDCLITFDNMEYIEDTKTKILSKLDQKYLDIYAKKKSFRQKIKKSIGRFVRVIKNIFNQGFEKNG